NPFQPRTHFEENALQELSDSIKQHGIIQPLTVRKMGYDKYQLISGERRFRASQMAGLKEVPAYIRIANDQDMLEMALVENIQREDLDAIEISLSYKRLLEECNLTQEALSEKVGKQRSTITNYLRLLKLPAEIQLGIRARQLSMGHARALINIESKEKQLAIYYRIADEDLSVRQVEELARGELKPIPKGKTSSERKQSSEGELSFNDQKIVTDLNTIFNSGVSLKRHSKGGGNVSFTFNNDTELEHLLSFFDL
ncbi:MAG: ParB/RepB/Spo0J family partition protein, partial [Bacteroidia bacterium]|nr:ParB/RepB/Spo0J family partition protein [Bacteroidia bacterium]